MVPTDSVIRPWLQRPRGGVLDCGLCECSITQTDAIALSTSTLQLWVRHRASWAASLSLYHILIIPSVHLCAAYMGTLATAGCAWSARGDPGYSGKWAGLARHGRCTPCSWAQWAVRVYWGLSQRPVRVDCGLSYTTVQATITLRSTIVACN